MRGFAVVTVLVVLVAIGLSFLVLPSQREVGTMLLRDRKYDESRRYFEQQLADGDVSPQVVTGLLRIYIENGDVERSIRMVERYGTSVGESPDVLSHLTELYHEDRRFGLYLRTLERLAAIQPTAERIEALADAYYKAGNPEKRAAALQWLSRMGAANAGRLLELADVQVELGRYTDAIESLAHALEIEPDAVDWSYRVELFDLLMRDDQTARAERLAERMMPAGADGRLIIAFAQSAAAHGDPDLAVRMLRAHGDLEATSDDWKMTLAYALRLSSRDDEAWDMLVRWWREQTMPLPSAQDLIALAVQRGDLELARTVLTTVGLDQVGGQSALLVIAALYRAGQTAAVDALVKVLGPDALNQDPVMATEIMLTRGDMAAAGQFADQALAMPLLPIDAKTSLAALLTRMGRAEDAFDLLRPLIGESALPTEGAIQLAELYDQLGRAEDGFWDVNALLAMRNTPRLRAIWAQLALTTGRIDLVVDWLDREPDIDATTVTDFYYIAERKEAWGVAASAARQIAAHQPSDEAALRLAYALYQHGDDAEALTVVAPLADRMPEAEGLYGDVLRRLDRREELAALWTRQIARPGLAPEQLESLVYALLEVGGDAVAWPHVLKLAETDGESWWFAAARSATRLGRTEELATLVADVVAGSDPLSENTAMAVYALADMDRNAAVAVMKSLAERAPERWSDGYLAGLRDLGRTVELVAWTRKYLATEKDTQRVLALTYALAELDANAAADALAPRAAESMELAELYAELLRRSGRTKQALSFEVTQAERGTFGVAYVSAVAIRALEAGGKDTALALLERVAGDAPPDSEAVRQLFYLWGPRPRPQALDWIAARARTATGTDRLRWIENLLNVRAGPRAIEVIGEVDGVKDDRELLLLVRAYGLVADREKQRAAIVTAVDRIKDAATLRELASLAETTADRGLVTRAWRAVLAAVPADKQAHRTLGLIAYDEGRLIDAERHLAAYLSNGDGDYEATYFYADILSRANRIAQAYQFFRKSYQQLTAIPNRDFTQEVTRANLLRRLGKIKEAVILMDTLVKQRPGDDALRADFADLLIEKGDLRRARSILNLQ